VSQRTPVLWYFPKNEATLLLNPREQPGAVGTTNQMDGVNTVLRFTSI